MTVPLMIMVIANNRLVMHGYANSLFTKLVG